MRGRDTVLKRDLATRLGITLDRLVILHDKEHQFLPEATSVRVQRNDMLAVLAQFRNQELVDY